MSASFLATTVPLCKVKLRLFYNSLRARLTGKKAVLIFFAALMMIFAISSAVSEMVLQIGLLGLPVWLPEWLIGFIAFYAIFVVLISDLLSGHTINAGQMSSDFDYLTTLPVPPASLLCVKIFERCASDYIGALVLLPGFIATTCREGFSVGAIFISLILFLQISLLLGTIINLVMLSLRRYLPMTSINNFFSIFGYFSGFAIFVPYALVDQSPLMAVQFLMSSYASLENSLFVVLQPVRWLGATLLHVGSVREFWMFSGLWFAAMVFFTFLLHRALNAGALSIRKTKTRQNQPRQHSRFSGLAQKDYLLMQSDYNIKVNALLMPITLILVNIFFVGKLLDFKTLAALLNLIFAGIVYFCMFGPTNAIGSEGRTISLLESLPLHPGEILRRKFVFWVTTATIIFLPLTVVAAWYLNFAALEIAKAAVLTMLFTAACVWAALQLSAIFPVFDSKMLQQSSTLSAKAAALGVMLLLVPIKALNLLNFYNALLFAVIVVLLNMKARTLMFYRLETSQHDNSQQRWINFMLLVFAFLGGEVVMKQFFLAVIPGEDTGLWTWVLPALVMTPLAMLTVGFKKQEGAALPLANNAVAAAAGWLPRAVAIVVFSALSTGGTWLYLYHNIATKELLTRELIYFAHMIGDIGLSYDMSVVLISALPVLAAAFFSFLTFRQVQSDLLTGRRTQAFIALAVLTAISPSPTMLPAALFSLLGFLYWRFFSSPACTALIAALSMGLSIALLLN
ncbi:MAG: hypothetical protein KKB51_04650 [Candidatus Riflebacteria bacterium]|nr:hypothetical protein [Candidatus Riflebacteria bacterium]